jgi:hypothetical protein
MPETNPVVGERWHQARRVVVRIVHTSEVDPNVGGARPSHISYREFGIGSSRTVPLEDFLADGWHPLESLVGRSFQPRDPRDRSHVVTVLQDGRERVLFQESGGTRVEEPIHEFLRQYEETATSALAQFNESYARDRRRNPTRIDVAARETILHGIREGIHPNISMGTAVPFRICSACGDRHAGGSGACEPAVLDLPVSPLAQEAIDALTNWVGNVAMTIDSDTGLLRPAVPGEPALSMSIPVSRTGTRPTSEEVMQCTRSMASDLLAGMLGNGRELRITGGGGTSTGFARADHVHQQKFTEQDIVGFSEEVIKGLGLDEETAAKIRAKYNLPTTVPVADPPDVWDRLLADDDDK